MDKTAIAFQNLGKAATTAAADFSQFSRTMFAVQQQIYNNLYQLYLKQGAVYGKTARGFSRWYDEAVADVRAKRREQKRLERLNNYERK